MIEFTPYASGSTGNFYTASDGKTNLIIECGIPIAKIKEKLKFKLSAIDACLVSHSHLDHCKAAGDLAVAGIDIYTSSGTIEACGLTGHRIHALEALKEEQIGTFKVLPFDVQHDVPLPLGFLLQSNITGEKLLFVTDTFYIKYRFNNLSVIAVECNYDTETLNNSIEKGYVHPVVAKRDLRSHMSLEHLIEMLKANDLSEVKQIYLMHLSSTNSNEKLFKTEIQKISGAEVYVC